MRPRGGCIPPVPARVRAATRHATFPYVALVCPTQPVPATGASGRPRAKRRNWRELPRPLFRGICSRPPAPTNKPTPHRRCRRILSPGLATCGFAEIAATSTRCSARTPPARTRCRSARRHPPGMVFAGSRACAALINSASSAKVVQRSQSGNHPPKAQIGADCVRLR